MIMSEANGDIQDDVEIKSQEPNFHLVKILSHGRSGCVKLVENAQGEQFVLKQMSKKSVKKEWVKNEVKAGKMLNHKGLVKLVKFFEDEEFHFVVLDYIEGEDLWNFMDRRDWKPLEEEETKAIFRQLLKAVEYCHLNGVAHKDIKPENIMIDSKKRVKLIDFGFCEFTSTTSVRFDGTPDYMPPELLLKIPFCPFKGDIFSMGVVLFVLLTGLFPYDPKKRLYLLKNGGRPCVDWSQECLPKLSGSAKNLLNGMLEFDPNERIGLGAIWRHDWIQVKSSCWPFWNILRASHSSSNKTKAQSKQSHSPKVQPKDQPKVQPKDQPKTKENPAQDTKS